MQRLFSTFPDGWPGLGLLILRCSLAVTVLALASGCLLTTGSLGHLARKAVVVGIAACLFLGFLTPVAAAAQIIMSAWALYLSAESSWIFLFVLALSLSLMMTGPGAWSIDAWQFGRRRLVVGRRPDRL